MKKLILPVIFLFVLCPAAGAFDSWAIIQQTVTQTAEHLTRLRKLTESLQVYKQQLSDLNRMRDIAIEETVGQDKIEFLVEFHNIVLESKDLFRDLRDLSSLVDGNKSLREEWDRIFGTLDEWDTATDTWIRHMELSDAQSSRGYKIADSYQDRYEQNAEYVRKLKAHSRDVSKLGSLQQIAEQTAHMIDMENQMLYLLSELLRAQSINNAQTNHEEKEAVSAVRQENEEVKEFIRSVPAGTLGM
ncbi:MAG: hypothetical protein KC897_13225 [Candidatus Omnitrophica bacterium]|nr:hypothetical protein [Candidatus Omnitrophota bacterium]